jgi:prepilin-type N-terminal cleavage/methylation domain-containing protein
MATHSRQRGLTLIESMLAVSIMLIGATGIAGLYTTGVRMNGNARRVTRATAIAQDLLNNIALWPYTSTALQNTSVTNDTDIADSALNFESSSDPVGDGIADHGEADLTALGTGWYGIPAAQLGGEYERYWNVATIDTNGDGTSDAIEVAVIVRWRQGTGWRRIVLLGAQNNPVGY